MRKLKLGWKVGLVVGFLNGLAKGCSGGLAIGWNARNILALNVSGLDWVEGLKNLSLSPQPNALPSPISTAFVEEPPSETVLEPSFSKSSPISTESSDSGYLIRSCSKRNHGGLGKDSVGTSKGRGRKSHLAKAQSRARMDLLEGKQISIERELRAIHAQKKGRR